MQSWLRSICSHCMRYLATILTLAALAGVALLGHQNDWKLPALNKLGRSGEPDKEEDSEQPQNASTRLRTIKLDSRDTVKRAGLQFARCSAGP